MRQGAAGKGRKQRFLGRDLDSFRKGLKELQDQVEAVEKVKQIYYLEVAGGEFEVWKSVAENVRELTCGEEANGRLIEVLRLPFRM